MPPTIEQILIVQSFVKKKQVAVYRTAYQKLGFKEITIEERLLAERDGLKLDQKRIRQENEVFRLMFEQILELANDGSPEAIEQMAGLLDDTTMMTRREDRFEDSWPCPHHKVKFGTC